MGNIIGDQFANYVAKQITVRQKAQGSGVDGHRSNGQLSYLNSKTSWVKFASAVSIDPAKLTSLSLPDSLSGMRLAKQNVLFGGTSYLGGPSSNQWLYEKPSDVKLSGYNYSKDWGIVPMPGVEDVSIKTLNRGSLEKATINVKAYSKEQFDIIDVLYLRLGYTVLLEWGNTSYLKNSGGTNNYGTVGGTLIEDNTRFFSDNFEKGGSFLSVLPIIDFYRNKYDGNYDGMLGKVSNFSWKFNTDGSYDITITVISLGDVIESLKSDITPPRSTFELISRTQGSNAGKDEESDDDVDSEYSFLAGSPINDSISAMLWFWKYVNKEVNLSSYIPSLESISITLGNNPSTGKNFIGYILEKGGNKIEEIEYAFYAIVNNSLTDQEIINGGGKFLEKFSNISPADADAKETEIRTNYFNTGGRAQIRMIETSIQTEENPIITTPFGEKAAIYIRGKEGGDYYLRFGDLLTYIQESIIPSIKAKNDKVPIFTIESKDWIGTKMYSLPNQISLDPRVCLVRNNKFQKRTDIFAKVLPQLLPFRVDDYSPGINTNAAYIMNIYLNFNFITDSIESNKDERGNVALFGLLSSICEGLNKALGGINNLEPIVDKTTNILKIIDSSPIPGVTKKTGDYSLEIYGYNKIGSTTNSNFIRNIDLKTAITPEYATTITVGATAGGYVKGTEATAFSKWNEGLTDRFNDELINNLSPTGSGVIDEAETNYVQMYLKELSKCYGFTGLSLNKSNGTRSIQFNDEAIDNNLNIVTEYYRYLQNKNGVGPSIGFIPFKLGLTLDGISGIKIFDQLHINSSFLPSNYGKTLDLIVTGITHKLSNDDWETSIEATVMPNSNKEVKELGIEKFAVVSPPNVDDDSFFGDFNFEDAVGSTVIGAGDQKRVDLNWNDGSSVKSRRSNTPGEARGAYRYLQLVGNGGTDGSSHKTTITNKIRLTSGCGWRLYPDPTKPSRHAAIDIAGFMDDGSPLPMTCPFKFGNLVSTGGTYNVMIIDELETAGGAKTGRCVRFLHSDNMRPSGPVVFNNIIGYQGQAGAPGSTHSHFEIFFRNQKAAQTTVDGKKTDTSPDIGGSAHFCPTIEEIKCAHGLSTTPLRLPIKEPINSAGITNYKCIQTPAVSYDPPTVGAILMTGLTGDRSHQYQVAQFSANYPKTVIPFSAAKLNGNLTFSNSQRDLLLKEIEKHPKYDVVLFSQANIYAKSILQKMKSVGAPANNLYLIEPYHGGGASTNAVLYAVNNGVPRDQVLLGPTSERGKGLLTNGFTSTPKSINDLGDVKDKAHFAALKWTGDKI